MQLSRRKSPLRYLFVLSPMRSGSSLLSHILASTPAVGGCGEHHVGYEKEFDLNTLAYRVSHNDLTFNLVRGQYVMDKLVWNYPICDQVLKNQNLYCIFLMRDPEMMSNSAAGLGDVSATHRKYQNPYVWMDYYRHRMNELKLLALRINDRARRLLLTYEELIGDAGRVLDCMQQFLDAEHRQQFPSRRSGPSRSRETELS